MCVWGKWTSKLAFQIIFTCLAPRSLSRENEIYGIAATALFNFVNWDFNITKSAQSASHCFAFCAFRHGCNGVFYHQVEKVCVLCNQTYSDTSQLEGYAGMEYHRIYATTCEEAVSLGYTKSGFRQIDPDGTAPRLTSVTVWCDLASEPGKAITELHHDHEAKTYVEGYEDCGSYSITLTYSVGLEVAKLVADLSSECTQQITYECYSSLIITVETGDPCALWKDRNGEISPYFTGDGSYSKYCDCRQTSSCSHSSGCECNKNEINWNQDKGNVTNKDDLPITEFQLGDTGGHFYSREIVYLTIGPLLCW